MLPSAEQIGCMCSNRSTRIHLLVYLGDIPKFVSTQKCLVSLILSTCVYEWFCITYESINRYGCCGNFFPVYVCRGFPLSNSKYWHFNSIHLNAAACTFLLYSFCVWLAWECQTKSMLTDSMIIRCERCDIEWICFPSITWWK